MAREQPTFVDSYMLRRRLQQEQSWEPEKKYLPTRCPLERQISGSAGEYSLCLGIVLTGTRHLQVVHTYILLILILQMQVPGQVPITLVVPLSPNQHRGSPLTSGGILVKNLFQANYLHANLCSRNAIVSALDLSQQQQASRDLGNTQILEEMWLKNKLPHLNHAPLQVQGEGFVKSGRAIRQS